MIYLLEDDNNIRNFVTYALNNSGLEAEGFGRPGEFWQALEKRKPQLVLLDIMLPEEDGLTVLDKLRHRVKLSFSVDDMAPLRRSGRLGNVKMSISTVLNIKPILEVREGAVVSTGIARGQIDRANKLCAFCKNAKGTIVVDGFLADEPASNLMARLAGKDRNLEHRRTGPVLGTHLGKGCVGVAYIEE